MRRLLPVLCLAVGSLIARAPSALACSCVQITIPDQYRQSDAVFIGTAMDVSGADARGNVIATIAVSDVYKGPVPLRAKVRTAQNGAACGVSFAIGTRYLIFVHGTAPFETNICNGTTTDLNALARAKIRGPVVAYRSPVLANKASVRHSSRAGPIAGAALLMVVVAAGSVLFWRIRSGRIAGGTV